MSECLIKATKLICTLIILGSGQLCRAQPDYDSLKTELEKARGTNRVDILNQIAQIFERENPDSSFYYTSQAEVLAIELIYKSGLALVGIKKGNYYTRKSKYPEAISAYNSAVTLYKELNDKVGLLKTYNNRGNIYWVNGDYDEALFNFLESLKLSEELGLKRGIAYASINVGMVYAASVDSSPAKGLPYYFRAVEICRELDDRVSVANAFNNIALVYSELKEYDKALDYHRQSLEIRQAEGDKNGIAYSLGHISLTYLHKGEYETSLKYNRQALAIYREVDDLRGTVYSLLDMGKAYFLLEKFDKAAPYLEEAQLIAKELNSLELKSEVFQYLFEYHLARKDYKNAFEYHRQYKAAKDSIYTENSSQQIALMRTLYETEKKEAAINRLTNENIIQNLELVKAENLKWFFIVASILTFLLAAFAYYGFRQKQKANVFLEERNKFEIENKKRAISLFGQQVSKEVALELLSDSFKSGSKKLFACIMFLDIRDFTPFAENKQPAEIIQYQNDVFGFMIDIISKHHGIINQFLGDGFMATFGAPASSGNDSQNAVNASREIVELLNKKCESGEIPVTRVGIGLHAGHIVTGNVGTDERKQYSITGNTVILASRIEQLNKEYNSSILISTEVLEKLDRHNLKTTNLGKIQLKGSAEPMEIVQLV